MKVAFACDTMNAGGAERVVSTLANSFANLGHEVSIVMVGKDADDSFYQLDDSINLETVFSRANSNIGFLKRAKIFKETLLSINPDIVISFLSYVCIYTWWALKNTNIPYIVSERNDPNKRSKFKQFLLNRAFRKASGCVFQTEDAFDWYKRIVRNKSTIIHNPVTLTYFPEHIEKRKKQILYVGRFSEQKNCLLLVKAFSKFLTKHPDYSLKMYGDGNTKDDIIKYIVDNKLDKKVFIESPSKTWQKDECNSSLFVLPSNYEGMPNVLAESLCLGIPSVSTDCPIGGPKELKKLFPNLLLLCKTNDVDDLVEKMEKALEIKNNKPFIPNELNSDYIANKWLEFINKMI